MTDRKLAVAPRGRRPRGRPRHPDLLTPVEWAIVLQVRAGISNGEIAQHRGCRVDTVKYHVANILGKLDLPDRPALQAWTGRARDDGGGIDIAGWQAKERKMNRVKPTATFTGLAPSFLVDDVARSAEWYRDHLGFEIGDYFREHHHGDNDGAEHDHEHDPSLGEPVFVILQRDGQRLMLSKTVERGKGVSSNYDFKEYSSDVFFWVDDVDAIFAQATAAGATVLDPPATQYYGLRDFRLKDLDGRVLTFGGPVLETTA
jgi:uncharacterized glyoxalase superfamily protein PhnB/DNA-binding CsgD family transcriptional regulator